MTDPKVAELRGMKRTATSLFLGVTVLFVVARSLEGTWPAMEYVRAFAEAAMVGALADWFAVTALFRHPLGIPIPHTAIIPNRKDDIGRGLGTFVQSHFLTPEVVTEKLSGTPIARRLGDWLSQPDNAHRLGEQAATVSQAMLDALRDDEIQESIELAIAKKVRATEAGPVLGRGLDLAIVDGRHQQLLSTILKRVAESLEANRPQLRYRLATESPWWVPGAVDERIFTKMFDGVQRLLRDVADRPGSRAAGDLRRQNPRPGRRPQALTGDAAPGRGPEGGAAGAPRPAGVVPDGLVRPQGVVAAAQRRPRQRRCASGSRRPSPHSASASATTRPCSRGSTSGSRRRRCR